MGSENENNTKRHSAADLRERRARGESLSDLARVRAKSEEELERDIASDADWKDIPTGTREKDLQDIASRFGTATVKGQQMLARVMAKYALDMLPDEAIAELAEMHRREEQHQVQEALRGRTQ